jgi:uncharacterized protein (DUF427 family)
LGATEVARTRQAIRVLETAHPPSFYIPWDTVARRMPKTGRHNRSEVTQWFEHFLEANFWHTFGTLLPQNATTFRDATPLSA